jgi:dihydrofolate synthase/folylpolyglutamate synthase
MNYKESLEFLSALPRFPTHAGLGRIKSLMQKLGDPQNHLKFIHVAGTNGKGSVCSMTASVLSAAGNRTGLYISPYIICFRERIQINGEYISEADFAHFATMVRETGAEVTEFEFITAVAFLYYKYKECDVVVLETGLGGRFDATNVISAPLLAIITGIGLDHTAVLGDSLEEIAAEKCGIIKSGSAVITTYTQRPEALSVIRSYAEVKMPDTQKLNVLSSDLRGNRFIYKGREYVTKLIGEYQIENALLAIEAASALDIPYNAVYEGIGNTRFPARLELLSDKPTVLLDGAHNPHGAEALAKVLGKHTGATAIIGMLADKNCDEVLSVTLPFLSRVICVTVNNPRALSADSLAAKAKAFCENVVTADSLDHALALAKGDSTVFIFGSLYLAAEIRQKAKDFYS